MLAAVAALCEGAVAVACEFDACAEKRGVDLGQGAGLDFKEDIDGGGRGRAAFEDPAAGVVDGVSELGELVRAVRVGEALNLDIGLEFCTVHIAFIGVRCAVLRGLGVAVQDGLCLA